MPTSHRAKLTFTHQRNEQGSLLLSQTVLSLTQRCPDSLVFAKVLFLVLFYTGKFKIVVSYEKGAHLT